MNKTAPNVRPLRPGLPLDPYLQLWAGQLTPLVTHAIGPGLVAQVTIPNPLRVALYVYPESVAGTFVVRPFDSSTGALPGWLARAEPVLLHCRDYPGLVQGPLWIAGSNGDQYQVQEYCLQPWWEI